MGFLNPVIGAEEFYFDPVTFAGHTSSSAQLSVKVSLSVTFAGHTVLAVEDEAQAFTFPPVRFSGRTVFTAEGNLQFAGRTTLSASLRLNDEANVFLAATLAGNTTFAPSLKVSGAFGASFAGRTVLAATLTLTVAQEESFLIVVDIASEEVRAASSSRIAHWRPRLKFDNTELPLSEFSYEEPDGQLGASLSVRLARPSPAQLHAEAAITFDVGLLSGGSWQWLNLLHGAALSGYSQSVSTSRRRPTDTLRMSTVDLLGDKSNLAPDVPRTLYDPSQTSVENLSDTSNALRDVYGTVILPVQVPIVGLDLKTALLRAYVEGCGFEQVYTNIPNIPVQRVDFTLEGGYDAGVRGLLSFFEPEFSVDANNNLWILGSHTEALPDGISPVELPLEAVITLSDSSPPAKRVSGLILTFTSDSSSLTFVEYPQTETHEDGTFGHPGYTSTFIKRQMRRYYDALAPETILSEIPVEITTEVSDYQGNVVARSVQRDHFDNLHRKDSHTREEWSRMPDPENALEQALIKTSEETVTILYGQDPKQPRRSLPFQVTTRTSGLVFTDSDNTYLGEPFKLSYKNAHRAGQLDRDAFESGSQKASFEPLTTRIEQARVRSDGGLDYTTITMDWTRGGMPLSSSSQPRSGEIAIDPLASAQHSIVLRQPGADVHRRMETFNAGQLSRELAISLGYLKLKRIAHPPPEATIEVPGVSRVRKGAYVRPHSRSGALGVYRVTARSISGTALSSRTEARITTTLTCKKVSE
ncbi:MAG: hypothetical protein WBP93_09460 [Pyrinomonadaceae bacterium]